MKLTDPQRRVLDNLYQHRPPTWGLRGRSAHGGHVNTMTSLVRLGLVTLDERLTTKGREAIRPKASEHAGKILPGELNPLERVMYKALVDLMATHKADTDCLDSCDSLEVGVGGECNCVHGQARAAVRMAKLIDRSL